MLGFFSAAWFNLRTILNTFSWRDALDIVLVAYLIYTLINLLTHTRTGLLFKGIMILLGAYLLASILGLKTIKFIIDYVIKYGLIVLVVIFQPELRSVLERIGRTELGRNLFSAFKESTGSNTGVETALQSICDSAKAMSATRTGALIVFERETPLNDIIATGTEIDAKITEEFIGNIFYKGAPLHDGAVVVRGDRVQAAGCILPVSHNFSISKEMGTRHRAALGISENSDAVVLVVSEENGYISIAHGGSIERNLSREEAFNMLKEYLVPEKTDDNDKHSMLGRIIK